MPYVVCVEKWKGEFFVYGLFESREDAYKWARETLSGYNWYVAQYTIAKRLS